MITKNSILASIIVMVSASNYVSADPVNLNITGKVIASPCTVGTSATINTDLGQTITADSLNTAGSSSTWVPISVPISGCPAGTSNVTATFSGTAAASEPLHYSNAVGAGYATNISIQLENVNGGTVANKGPGTTMVVPVSSGAATFSLRARVHSKSGGATVGNIATVVQMNFTYQ